MAAPYLARCNSGPCTLRPARCVHSGRWWPLAPPAAGQRDCGVLSPLRPRTPALRTSNRAPEAKCSRVLGSQRRSSQFLVFLSTSFLLRGLPRGSESGEGPGWVNPRPRPHRARVVELLVAHLGPTGQCSFLPRKFDLFRRQQEL